MNDEAMADIYRMFGGKGEYLRFMYESCKLEQLFGVESPMYGFFVTEYGRWMLRHIPPQDD